MTANEGLHVPDNYIHLLPHVYQLTKARRLRTITAAEPNKPGTADKYVKINENRALLFRIPSCREITRLRFKRRCITSHAVVSEVHNKLQGKFR